MNTVRPNHARSPIVHPDTAGTANHDSAKSTILLTLPPRAFHHISFGDSSATLASEAARPLRSSTAVCRTGAPVSRRYLQEAAFSCTGSLVRQRPDGGGEHLKLLLGVPLYLYAARRMLYKFLLKVPLSSSFSFVTLVTLGSVQPGKVAVACLDGLCRTIASLEPLRKLELMYVAWADSASYHPRPSVHPQSRARLHEIGVWAERKWLLDIRSVRFLTWMAQSGTVSGLTKIHLEGMMLVNERLLAAVAAVIDASKGSLQELFLSAGPNLSTHPCEYCCS